MGDFGEVAHIIPKSKFKSVATNDLNVIYLCGWSSKNNCHAKFDNYSLDKVKSMNCYKECRDRFAEIESDIEENISYKYYDKWGD